MVTPARKSGQRRLSSLPFRPRARLLVLLGDQLIRDAGIAAFELVKNAYDADASEVVVTIHEVGSEEDARIVFEDDGEGMDWETVTHVWLEPGTDNRSTQRASGKRSRKFKRMPLGEKGVGRFAVHKLGQRVQLVTRRRGQPEIVVDIDWTDFEDARYLEDVGVQVSERDPAVFTGRNTGTRIEVFSLRARWTRRMVRNLHRAITSIQSPFEDHESFRAELLLEPDPGWLHNLLTVEEALDLAMFRAQCQLAGDRLTYEYEFRPLAGMDRVSPRTSRKRLPLTVNLDELEPGSDEDIDDENGYAPATDEDDEDVDTDAEPHPLEIGPVTIDLFVFDRDPAILALGVSDRQSLLRFLNQNGGVRVYRDGIRVYDYGEQGNDWLGLGGRRVNEPARKISNNLVLGAVSLDLAKSTDLVEKTNREGFVENAAFRVFRTAVLDALQHVEAERNQDKERIRRAYAKGRTKEPVLDDLTALRRRLRREKLDEELGGYLDRIESQFLDVRDRLLTAAGAGLSLAVVIHEVEKGISELNRAVNRSVSIDRIRELARHLEELIDGFTYLTRRSGISRETASKLLQQATFNTEYRARYHNIEIVNGIETGRDGDFTIRCTRRLIVATLMNLIDNSIYWLDVAKPRAKRIYLGTSDEFDGPALIVADSGPGFADPPEYLTQPFLSRRKDGMGLGLHIADEVMKAHEGRLVFADSAEVALPRGFSGAVVALVFPEQ